MNRTIRATAFAMLIAAPSLAQEAAGSLIMTIDGEERPFALVQGSEGANPGSRYSRLGEDVVMTIVGVPGDVAQAPDEADETVELRLTIDGTGPEARAGAVISYSTRDAEGMPSTRGGTVDVAIDSLETSEDGVTASGTFAAELPPDHESSGSEVEGTFTTAMKSRDAPDT